MRKSLAGRGKQERGRGAFERVVYAVFSLLAAFLALKVCGVWPAVRTLLESHTAQLVWVMVAFVALDLVLGLVAAACLGLAAGLPGVVRVLWQYYVRPALGRRRAGPAP